MSLNVTHVSNNVYSANLSGSYNKVAIFGGNIIAQAVNSAYKEIPDNMSLHSLNMYFISRGDPKKPVFYKVETLMEGRSYHKKQVNVEQDGKLLAKVQLSFKVDENSEMFVYNPKMPEVVHHSNLEIEETYYDLAYEKTKFDSVARQTLEHRLYWIRDIPMEIKHLDYEVALLKKKNEKNYHQKWMKIDADKLIDTSLSFSGHVILAFVSDLGILSSIIYMNSETPIGFQVSLDHTMWFRKTHKPIDWSKWFLFHSECIYASNSTTVNSGQIWSEDGELLVNMMQEGIVRPTLPNKGKKPNESK